MAKHYFKKGYTPWNKGKKMSEDFSRKIRIRVTEQWKNGIRKGGHKLSKETIERMSKSRIGKYRNRKICICEYCKKEFSRAVSSLKKRTFCNPICNAKWMKYVRKTEDHPLYKGIGNKNTRLYWKKAKEKNPILFKLRKNFNNRIREDLKRGAGGRHTLSQWLELKVINDNSCKFCKRKEPDIKLTRDHIVPISKWKDWEKKYKPSYRCNNIENIQPLCVSCNCKKHSKLI